MRAQSLDRALPAIAGFITDRTGIQIIRGSRACTDSESITLPRRRSEIDLTERDLVESVAYVYHEASHMLHSNFTLSAKSPLERAITGALEDIRIERLIMSDFPAARRYLSRLVEYMVDDGMTLGSGFPPLDGSESESLILQCYMHYRLRHEVLRQEAIAGVCATATKAAHMRFPSGMMTRLEALMFEVTNCESEDEVFALAAAIIEMIKDEKEKEEQKQQEQQKQQEASDAQQGDEQSQQQAGSSQQQGNDPAESDDGSGSGSGTDSDDKSPSGQSAADGDSSSDDGTSQEAGSKGEGAGGAASLDKLLGMSDDEVQEDLGEMLRNALNASAADESTAGVHIPMPNRYRANLRDRGVDMAALRASVNATRTRTLQWMSSVAEGDSSHSRSGMMIDSSRIWSGRLGGSVFLREDEGIDLNAAVSIVIDRSGSMTSIIGHAVQAAVATMLAFDTPGIQTQVSVFPWVDNGEEGVAVIKRWDDSPRSLAGRMSSLTATGGTPMAEAILFAASEVARREETLKIVLVVTDGDPNDRAATRYIIDRARADGITVVALGIGVDPAPVFDEQYAAAISDIGQLSSSMVRLVKAAFEANRRLQ